MNYSHIVYQKLREARMCEEMREDYPDWPYPMLFHGHEISRHIYFLDDLIEYRQIKLGRNLVCDGGSVEIPKIELVVSLCFFQRDVADFCVRRVHESPAKVIPIAAGHVEYGFEQGSNEAAGEVSQTRIFRA